MPNPSELLNPNLEDQDMEIKPTVMGPPAFGSPDPETAAAYLAPVVDHPLRASLSEDYGAGVIEDSNLASTRGGASEVDEEMSAEDLRNEADRRGLAKSGTKKELVARITEFDEAQAELEEDETDDDDNDDDDN